ncbi:penicillinase repressor [Adhaeribacter aerolatus]|uniref:Penicillinase repressor n=1 Tax=Adhaeribacter aerolatus TaxID=670289 RepID=A0A512ASB6_9BACT|nr:BlaI/MecI/CopY family transcriptional regulator [Adhaeribacter aerolatus]GEO02599.1 penicillinase repressor [Adhaeribacter aerolatus]
MAAAQPLKPTDAELEILQVLWQNGPSTVRFVNDELNKTKEVGYTTTLKIMQLMTEKNMVRRDESNRSHVYEALLKEEATQKQLLNKFLDTTFRGSASRLVMQALGSHQTTPEELNQIRELLNKLEGGSK